MRTTTDIDDALMREAIRAIGRTKRAVVERAWRLPVLGSSVVHP